MTDSTGRESSARQIASLLREARRLIERGSQVSESEREAFLRRKTALVSRLEAEANRRRDRGGRALGGGGC
ncbi:MAG TPA: hypothetical protein VFJ19_06460 [Nocardioidaceae bacterium]|nr:hypothetical protein [Nocardioidaceae bacterium]